MQLMEAQTLETIRAVAELCIIPLIAVIWQLNNSIRDLKILMFEKFLTFEGHMQWHAAERSGYNHAQQNMSLPSVAPRYPEN